MKKQIAFLLQLALALLLSLAALAYLAGGLASLATDEGKMLDKMKRYSESGPYGVDRDEYPALAKAITGYLKGSEPSPQLRFQADGDERLAFSESELIHLEDVRHLIGRAKRLRIVALALVAFAILFYLLLRAPMGGIFSLVRIDKALIIAAWLVLIPMALVILWAVIDFEGFFHAAHRQLFTNDLWLLDPQDDLLIQLMPLPFFISYVWDFIKQNLFLLLALPLAAFGLKAGRRQSAEESQA